MYRSRHVPHTPTRCCPQVNELPATTSCSKELPWSFVFQNHTRVSFPPSCTSAIRAAAVSHHLYFKTHHFIISSFHQFTYAGLLFSAYLFQRFSFLFDLLQCFQTLNNVMVEIIDQHVPLIFSLLHIHCNHLCFVSIHSLCLG